MPRVKKTETKSSNEMADTLRGTWIRLSISMWCWVLSSWSLLQMLCSVLWVHMRNRCFLFTRELLNAKGNLTLSWKKVNACFSSFFW